MAESYLGYNFCGAIDGHVIPQRLQNTCIRDYAQANKLVVAFSASEYSDSSQSLILLAQFEHLDRIAGFIFYSLLLLPSDDRKRKLLYEQVLKAGKSIHFALENLVINSEESATSIERLYRISIDKRFDETRHALIELYRQSS